MTEDAVAELQNSYYSVLFIGLIVVMWLETAAPQQSCVSERERAFHAGRQFGLWVISVYGVNALTALYFGQLPVILQAISFGLVDAFSLTLIGQLVIGLVILDLGGYVLHILQHRVRWLWLLHAVHHSDSSMDVTTSLRVHPIEGIISLTWSTLLLCLTGLPLWVLIVRTLFNLPFTLLQHANVVFPERIDRPLRSILITPLLHRIHHSPLQCEANSNYGLTFSIWDRLFGTLRVISQPKEITYGLLKLRGDNWQGVWGMLKTPLAARGLMTL